jgi:hypothetical protein
VETKWAEAPEAPRPRVAWVTTNSSGVSFRLDPYKVTLVQVGGSDAAGELAMGLGVAGLAIWEGGCRMRQWA